MLIETNKPVRECWFYIITIISGWSAIHDTLKNQTYSYNEMWTPFMVYSICLGMFNFTNWRKLVIIEYMIILGFMVLANISYYTRLKYWENWRGDERSVATSTINQKSYSRISTNQASTDP